MIAVRLTGGIPVPSRCLKRVLGITDDTVAEFMDMKTKRPDGRLFAGGRLVCRETGDVD